VCKANNLPPSCAVVTKSGKLNFLEPSGPLRSCNGRTDLSLLLGAYTSYYIYFLFSTRFGHLYVHHQDDGHIDAVTNTNVAYIQLSSPGDGHIDDVTNTNVA